MARRIKKIPPLARIEIKKDAWHHNNLLLQTSLEEVQAIVNALRQRLQVQPKIKRAVRDLLILDVEPNLAQPPNNVVPLHLEMRLQSAHFLGHLVGFEHGDGGLLKRYVATAIEVRAARANGFDELSWADDPRHAPAGKAEALGQAVDDQHVILVDVDDVGCRADDRAVAVGGVVVAAVELVHDQGGAIAAEILDVGQLRVDHHLPRRVSGVRGQDDGRAARDFLGNLVRVNVVVIFARQGNRDRRKVPEERQHLVVRGVVRNEKGEIGVAEHGGDANQASSSSGNDAHVLPRVLALFSLAVVLIVELCDGGAEGLDAGGGAILTTLIGDGDCRWLLEASFDVVFGFGSALSQVGP